MTNLWIAFITGLTTGGLSCLAVQGGLLASSMAQQLEADVMGTKGSMPNNRRKSKARSLRAGSGMPATDVSTTHVARPILLFLGSKLVAYTILGFLLGAIGSILQLNSATRAVLQLAIGIFMIGNALRMLNVHPIFRYFAFEPPSGVTRAIRRVAKRDASSATPLILGAMTVLIPCGITQAMMATAMGSGNPLSGAALMAAFILGTSPVFFAVAYSTMRLGAKLEGAFMRVIAVVVLVLGFLAIETGLNMLGSPISASRLVRAARAASAPTEAPTVARAEATPVQPGEPAAADGTAVQALTIEAKNNGYFPATQHAVAGVASELEIITDNTRSCSRAFGIPSLWIDEILPETGSVTVKLPAMDPGTVLRYSCSMGMYTGEIIFDK